MLANSAPVANEADFFEKILSFIGVADLAKNWYDGVKDDFYNAHFRKGRIDEWREIVPAQDYDRLFALIDPKAAEFFGWKP